MTLTVSILPKKRMNQSYTKNKWKKEFWKAYCCPKLFFIELATSEVSFLNVEYFTEG